MGILGSGDVRRCPFSTWCCAIVAIGHWTQDYGQRIADSGQWTTDGGQGTVDSGHVSRCTDAVRPFVSIARELMQRPLWVVIRCETDTMQAESSRYLSIPQCPSLAVSLIVLSFTIVGQRGCGPSLAEYRSTCHGGLCCWGFWVISLSPLFLLWNKLT